MTTPAIGSIIAGMKFADAPTNTYGTAQLQADLAAGVGKIVAGTGSNYRLTADPANGAILIGHVSAVYNGPAAAGGGIRPMLGITAAGLAMGYNDNAGAWHNSIAIDASGNASFSGAINATSGNFTGTINAGSVITGTITAGSVIADTVTVGGTALSTVKSGAAAGATAVQPAAIANFITSAALVNLIDSSAATVLSGTITPASGTANKGAFKIGTITWNTSGVMTSGSGIAITAGGIIGASGGVPTFSIDASGNAKFKGDITGSNGAFAGTVSAANLTAGTISAGISINSSGSVNATGIYGSALGNVSIVGAPTVAGHGVAGIANGFGTAGIYGTCANANGYGMYGLNSSTGTGVAGVCSSGVDLLAGGSGKIGFLGTTAYIKYTSGLFRVTDATSTDAYLLMASAAYAGGGATATMGPIVGSAAALKGWLTCKFAGSTIYVPYWQ